MQLLGCPHPLTCLGIQKSDPQAPTWAGAASAVPAVPVATRTHTSHAGTQSALSPQLCADTSMEFLPGRRHVFLGYFRTVASPGESLFSLAGYIISRREGRAKTQQKAHRVCSLGRRQVPFPASPPHSPGPDVLSAHFCF